MSDLDQLFVKIAAGEIPSYKVYEDEHTFAFLDINPISRGHTLVIPRKRWERVEQLPADVAAALGKALPVVARAVMQATGASSYNVLANVGKPAGQIIPHVHFHIIPKYDANTGLPHSWPAKPIDEKDATLLQTAIINAIS